VTAAGVLRMSRMTSAYRLIIRLRVGFAGVRLNFIMMIPPGSEQTIAQRLRRAGIPYSQVPNPLTLQGQACQAVP
jgi:hypothetical protein